MRPKYNTKQRELIYNVIVENSHLHMTPEDIYAKLRNKGQSVGLATIYRYLDILVADNTVRKYQSGNGTGSCFQYVGDQAQCRSHYHLVCNICSSLTHMECTYMDGIFDHLEAQHSFKVDPVKTVVYGRCSKCTLEGTNSDDK